MKKTIPALANAAVKHMNEVLASLPLGGAEFRVTKYKYGHWVAESVNIDGIMTGVAAEDDMDEMIRDAIFTFFEIPRKFCDQRLLESKGEIESSRGGKPVMQSTSALIFKKQLRRSACHPYLISPRNHTKPSAR